MYQAALTKLILALNLGVSSNLKAPMFMSPSLVAILVGSGLVIYYLYAPYWKVRKVPGPPPYPLVGHLPLMAKYGPDVFAALAKLYGPIFRCPVSYFLCLCFCFGCVML